MMKKYILFFVFIAGLVCGCSFNKGVKKNLATGLYYSHNGFKGNNVVAYNGYNERLQDNKLPENSILMLYFDNIENFTVVDGKVSIGCELTVTDPDGNTMLHYDDLYKDLKAVSLEDAKYSHVRVTLAKPIVAGKTYTVKSKLFDKKNEKNYVNVDMEVEVTPSEVDIKHESKVLTFEKFWFGTKDGELPENKVRINNKAAIVLKGVSGFTLTGDTAFPGCSVAVIDSNGVEVMQSDDIFASAVDGVTAKQAEDLSIEVTYATPIHAKEKYHVHAKVFDKKNPDAGIVIDMDVDVVE